MDPWKSQSGNDYPMFQISFPFISYSGECSGGMVNRERDGDILPWRTRYRGTKL